MTARVYLISALDKDVLIDNENIVYKIGITKQEKDKRLKQLSTGNDKDLKIVYEFKSDYPFKLEGVLHRYFQSKKINKEWYKLNTEDVKNFISTCELFENNFKCLNSVL